MKEISSVSYILYEGTEDILSQGKINACAIVELFSMIPVERTPDQTQR